MPVRSPTLHPWKDSFRKRSFYRIAVAVDVPDFNLAEDEEEEDQDGDAYYRTGSVLPWGEDVHETLGLSH